MAAVLIAGGASFAAILIWAPPDVKQWLIGANGLIGTVVAYLLTSPRDVQQRTVELAASVVEAVVAGDVPVVVSVAPAAEVVTTVAEVAPADTAETP